MTKQKTEAELIKESKTNTIISVALCLLYLIGCIGVACYEKFIYSLPYYSDWIVTGSNVVIAVALILANNRAINSVVLFESLSIAYLKINGLTTRLNQAELRLVSKENLVKTLREALAEAESINNFFTESASGGLVPRSEEDVKELLDKTPEEMERVDIAVLDKLTENFDFEKPKGKEYRFKDHGSWWTAVITGVIRKDDKVVSVTGKVVSLQGDDWMRASSKPNRTVEFQPQEIVKEFYGRE